MNTINNLKSGQPKLDRTQGIKIWPAIAAGIILSLSVLGQTAEAAVPIDQVPLTLSNNVPGNLVLTPSVEWPTVMSMANLGGFSSSTVYGGYFDPNKCYTYSGSGIPTSTPAPQMAEPKTDDQYFVPVNVSSTAPATCSGQWSGNYLNWAATQTIDTFRSVMTGGYRVIDTASTTVLEKARHTGQTGTGALNISNSAATVGAATPSSYKYFSTKLSGLGNKMYFVSDNTGTYKTGNGNNGNSYTLQQLLNNPTNAASNNKTGAINGVIPYTGQTIEADYVYSVNIDVQVCKSGLTESNCVKYGSNYKPEGLIQKYSKTFTYSVFGYLNISNELQDGAALRAQQGFVGPYTYDPINGIQVNNNEEWDPSTGVLIQNPNPIDASNTTGATILDSGVINYINKFGEMNSGNDKSHDPVSEMYYAAIRYLKHQGPVASYSNITTYAEGTAYHMADGFPIITSWNDPMKYACQKNFILGIGDANTWDDKNLPGNTASTTNEPPVPAEVSADSTVNVATATQRVATIEGITIPTPFTGRNNSAYIAGLAYDSHTKDMRPDLTGTQTASTYWVDVEENQVLLPINKNQYQLAAKYGGFTVPSGFNPYTYTGPMPKSWWSTSGDILTTSGINESRPDNFFEGGNATSMRSGLNAAFSAIASQNQGSVSSFAVNSSSLQTGSTFYQGGYKEGAWSGSLKATSIDPNTYALTSLWDAASVIPAYASRKVYTLIGGAYKAFNATNVTGNGWTTNVVNYVLGQKTYEIQNGGPYRNRTTALGDIVDSQPIYVGTPNTATFAGQTFTGSSTFNNFATSGTASTRAPTVYVAANDGMLHGFDAATGIESYAYMPGAVESASTNPSILAQANYGSGVNPHQYFNDGLLTTADVYYSGNWHTVLVGTTGRGVAKAIYALDVTDPTNVQFLWEKSAASSSYIGQITGRPIIANTANGWVVLIGNGYNSTTGASALLSIALDGSSNPSVNVYTADAGPDNGLSTPTVLISNASTGIATTAYAGDLLGNVWAFDLSSASGAGTRVYTTPVDAFGNHQPITSALLLGKDPSTGHLWLFFGTGKYLSTTDLTNKQTQSWYGLIVDGTLPIAQSSLFQRSIAAETTGSAGNPSATPPVPATNPARAISTGTAADLSGKSGWYIDLLKPPSSLAEGERMLVGNQFKNGLLIGTTLIPDTSDPCAPSGRGWVMAVQPFTGLNPTSDFFDMNNDGTFNSADQISVNGTLVPSAGISFSSLTGSATFMGSAMLNNLNGTPDIRKVQSQPSTPSRVSWRELINQ